MILFFSCKKDVEEKDIPEASQTVYYFIRHAEKDRSDKSNRNPELLAIGHERAKNWSEYFDTITLDVVYSTNYKRTIQTATPTAESKQLTVELYDAGELYDRKFQLETKGKNVLVVGHSNTTPMFVNKILQQEKYPWMHDKDNASLYKVTVIDSVVHSEVIKVE